MGGQSRRRLIVNGGAFWEQLLGAANDLGGKIEGRFGWSSLGATQGGAIKECLGGDSGGVSGGAVWERRRRSDSGGTTRERHGSELVNFGSFGRSTLGGDLAVIREE
ncbi:unnamed protein product [Calypogeia fissa]